jgi:hypothetical protein
MQPKRAERSTEERTVRASISFPEQQYLVLERIAAEHRVSLAWVVRDAINGYLQARWPLLMPGENSKATGDETSK